MDVGSPAKVEVRQAHFSIALSYNYYPKCTVHKKQKIALYLCQNMRFFYKIRRYLRQNAIFPRIGDKYFHKSFQYSVQEFIVYVTKIWKLEIVAKRRNIGISAKLLHLLRYPNPRLSARNPVTLACNDSDTLQTELSSYKNLGRHGHSVLADASTTTSQ